MALFSIDFIPIYCVSVFIGLEEAAYLSISLIIVKLLGLPFELLGSLIIPLFGKQFKSLSKEVFNKRINYLLLITFISSVIFSIIGFFMCPFLIRTFFPNLISAVNATQYIILATPFYILFVMLKNVFDIIAVRPFNSLLLIFALVLLLLVLFFGIYNEHWFYYRVLILIIPYSFLGIASVLLWNKLKKL
jgi:magnesium-transporting ATPase (P-type)